MVCLDFFLWAFICHVSTFSTVKTCSFYFAAVHLSLARLLGLGVGLLFRWSLTFSRILRRSGLSIGVLWLRLVGLAVGALASLLVSSCSVHSGIVAFSYSNHLVPGVFWPELWFHILG